MGPTNKLMPCPQCRSNDTKTAHRKLGVQVLRCLRCSLVFAGEVAAYPEIERQYEDYYSDTNTTINATTTKRYVEFLRLFEPYRNRNRILDLGCGCGFFLAAALAEGWDAYGTEVSPSALYYAGQAGLPASRIFLGDVSAARFDEGSFDVVTMFEVIEHLPDPHRVVRALWRLLREGGLLYLTTPNYDSLSRYLLGDSWSIIHPTEHLFYFTVPSLGRLLSSTGYHVCSVRTTGSNYCEIVNRHVFRRAGYSYATMQRGRERIERNGALRLLKRCVNSSLSLTRLGDTIKVLAEKRS